MSKAATKRMPLNTKRARKGYYKGKGGTKEGHITSKGRFIVDHKKRLELLFGEMGGYVLVVVTKLDLGIVTPELSNSYNKHESIPCHLIIYSHLHKCVDTKDLESAL